jgi:hypothetical protein
MIAVVMGLAALAAASVACVVTLLLGGALFEAAFAWSAAAIVASHVVAWLDDLRARPAPDLERVSGAQSSPPRLRATSSSGLVAVDAPPVCRTYQRQHPAR